LRERRKMCWVGWGECGDKILFIESVKVRYDMDKWVGRVEGKMVSEV
jgi:hypothetical protein